MHPRNVSTATRVTCTIPLHIPLVAASVDAVADLMGAQVVVRDDRDLGRETASEGRFGYASRHLQIALDAAREGQPAYAHLVGRNVQV